MYYQCSFISCQVVLVKIRVKTCIFHSYRNSYRRIVKYQLCYENKKTITLSDFLSFFIQDLQPEGRLQLVLKDLRARDQPDQSLPTSHQETQLKSFLKKYVGALTENIDAQFQESPPVLDSFKIFDLLSVPCLLWVLWYHGFNIKQIRPLSGLCFFIYCFTISFS